MIRRCRCGILSQEAVTKVSCGCWGDSHGAQFAEKSPLTCQGSLRQHLACQAAVATVAAPWRRGEVATQDSDHTLAIFLQLLLHSRKTTQGQSLMAAVAAGRATANAKQRQHQLAVDLAVDSCR